MTLLEALRLLRINGPKRPLLGICNNVAEYACDDDREAYLEEAFSEFGLDPSYPVTGMDAYADASEYAMWSSDRPYGA
jgi:hypothetical protein